MRPGNCAVAAIVVLVAAFGGTGVLSQAQPPTQGPAVDGSPTWFLRGSFPDPTGRTIVDSAGRVIVPPRDSGGGNAMPGSAPPAFAGAETPPWRQSPLCGKRAGRSRQLLQRVQWQQTMGYTFTPHRRLLT